MKLVLLAIGMVFSFASTNAMASGCNPRDAGQDVATLDFRVSGELICVAGQACVLQVSGSYLKLTGTAVSAENSTQFITDLAGQIRNERTWGSCDGRTETVVVSVVINGQTYSGKLSSYAGY